METPVWPGSVLCRVLVGRDDETARLQAAFEAAGHGSGRVVFVAGAAGMGKSRVTRELAARARTAGASVLVGRASATSLDTPLRPLREALLGLSRTGYQPVGPELEPFRPALARLVPDWGPSDAADASAVVLGEGILRLLEAQSSGRGPAVLVLDDLHWADRETLAVVEYLADNIETHHALVVGTLRDDELGPGRESANALIARRAAQMVRLGALDAGDVAAMARSCLGSDVLPEGLAASLATRSEGNPFLVEELLAAAVSTGTLKPDELGGWSSRDQLDQTVPDTVLASVTVRLHALRNPLVRLLHTAALLGRQFDWELAAIASGCPTSDAPDHFRRAVLAQLLEVDGDGYRFRHALTRDAVVADIVPGERARIASSALDALYAIDPTLAGDRCELAANLAAEAGEVRRANQLLEQAAERALADGSLASAEALAERARSSTDPVARDRIDALLLEIWTQAGHADVVAAAGGELLRSLTANRAPPAASADVHIVMARAALAAGRDDEAVAQVRDARALVPHDPHRRARFSVIEAQSAMSRADGDRALSLAQAALAAAERTDQVAVQCEALEVIGRAVRVRDVTAAGRAFERAYQLAADSGLTVWRVRAMQELGTIDMFETLAIDRLERARREAMAAGTLSIGAVIDLQLAATYAERADVDLALEAARRCEDTSRRLGLATLPMSITVQSFAHARAGRHAEMEAAIDAALATGHDQANVVAGIWGNGRAIYHLCRGDVVAASAALDQSTDALRRSPGGAYPFTGLWALIRTVLDDGGDEARRWVRALASDTPISRAIVTAADAVAAGRRGEAAAATAEFTAADTALARFEGEFHRYLVRLLVAPCAANDGWGDPVAWLRGALAVFEEEGFAGLAETCRARLRDVGAPVPRRTGSKESVPAELAALGVTVREMTVLALLATGGTNKAIAEELFLSPRTVEKHVERLMMKAGTTRSGLADLARRTGVAAG